MDDAAKEPQCRRSAEGRALREALARRSREDAVMAMNLAKQEGYRAANFRALELLE